MTDSASDKPSAQHPFAQQHRRASGAVPLSVLLTPWYRRSELNRGSGTEQLGSIDATPILDHGSVEIQELLNRSVRAAAPTGPAGDPTAILQAAHTFISREVRGVYAMEETTAASRVLRRGSGSCSQRLAILESVARALGTPTRARALLIDRAFWYPRFPRFRWVLPAQVLLLWPEFDVDGWKPASELFGSIGCRGGRSFTNSGAETLFEAAGRCAVDWDGQEHASPFDLSHFVLAELGYFQHRDDAFRALGQTLCTPARRLADPVLRRVAA